MLALMFAFDSGRQMLVFPHPATGQPLGIAVAELRAISNEDGTPFWHVDEVELRKVLPRFGPPIIHTPRMRQ